MTVAPAGTFGDYNRIRADDYVIANGYTSQYPSARFQL